MAYLWKNSLPSSVTATELLTAYRDNPAEAEAKYRGRWLQLTGRVADNQTIRGPGFDPRTVTWVTLIADDTDIPGEVTIRVPSGWVDIERSNGPKLEDFKRLRKGQQVTIHGQCSGKTAPSGAMIERASIVK
jgi:hypothetical protein